MVEDCSKTKSDRELKIHSRVSLHAMDRTNHPQTIRLLGKVKGRDVTILIGSGSTHNFVDQKLAKQCGFVISKDKKLKVMVANREQIMCKGMCEGVCFLVQDYQSVANFYVLPIAACPIVPGV